MAANKKQIMVIEALERNLAMCRKFMDDWLLFNQILKAYPGPGVNKAQLETQFLKIKSTLAREHQVLKEALAGDYKFDSGIMNIVSGATNLESIYTQSEVSIKKLENEWHRAFISINETIGLVEDKKRRADAGERIYMGPAGGVDNVKGGGGMSGAVIFLIIFAVVAVGLIGSYFAIPAFQTMVNTQLGIR